MKWLFPQNSFDFLPTILSETTFPSTKYSNVTFNIVDTLSTEEHDRIRPCCYPHTQLVFIAFNCMDVDSFKSVQSKWIPEIRHHLPHVPIILLGTKIDLRHNWIHVKQLLAQKAQHPIQYEMGKEMAQKMGCISYLELSAFESEELDILEDVIVGGVGASKNVQPKCIVQ